MNFQALPQDLKGLGVGDLIDEEFQGEHAALDRAEAIRGRIRGQLDEIEPIWTPYGNQVEVELRNRKPDLRPELSLSPKSSRKRTGTKKSWKRTALTCGQGSTPKSDVPRD